MRSRLYLSLEEKTHAELTEWAEQQGRPVTNLATWLVEQALHKAKQTGEYVPGLKQGKTTINILDIQRLADQLDIPSDKMLEAIKAIKLEVTNGH